MRSRNYDDIIDLPAPVSKKHKQMPKSERASQFAPFAALSGHQEAIEETARLVDQKPELTEDQLKQLNDTLTVLMSQLWAKPLVDVCYFAADKHKQGGSYRHFTGSLKKVDEVNRYIEFTDRTRISFDDLLEINTRQENDLLF